MNRMYNVQLELIKPSASMSKGLSEGSRMHNLAIGSPDIPVPDEILDLIQNFAKNPDFSYQPTKGGIDTISNVIKLIDPNNEKLVPEKNVILTPGAKYGIYLSLKTICNVGDMVLLIEPYWLSYTDICNSLGLISAFWKPSNLNYTLESLINIVENSSKKPKVLIVNNPINPSGFVFDKLLLDSIIEYCRDNKIWLILDEVYKDLCFDLNSNLHDSLFSDNLIRVGSFSKSLALPGLRSGYIFASDTFISNFNLFHQHIATSINSLTRYILNNVSRDTYIEYTKKCSLVYKERYSISFEKLTKKGFKPIESHSTFYMLVGIENKFQNGLEACDYYEKKGILLTPGIHYGSSFNNYFRICLTRNNTILSSILNLM